MPAPCGAPQDRGQLIVFDDATFDRLAAHPLAAQELACSLTSVKFAGGWGVGGGCLLDEMMTRDGAGGGVPTSTTSNRPHIPPKGDDTSYYALGTAVVKPEEYEPTKGRLVLLAYRWVIGDHMIGSCDAETHQPNNCDAYIIPKPP